MLAGIWIMPVCFLLFHWLERNNLPNGLIPEHLAGFLRCLEDDLRGKKFPGRI